MLQEKSGIEKVSCIGRRHHGFFPKFFVPQDQNENFIRERFCFSKTFLKRNFSKFEGEYQQFASKLLTNCAEKNRRRTLLCFRKLFVSKKILDMRGRITASANIFSHSTEKLHKRSLLCFRKLVDLKISLHWKRSITALLNFFVSRDQNEKLRKGALVFQKLSCIENFLDWSWLRLLTVLTKKNCHSTEKLHMRTLLRFKESLASQISANRKGGNTALPKKNGLRVSENFTGEQFRVSGKNGFPKKSSGWEGGYGHFPSKLFRITVPKISVREPLWLSESFWYRLNFWIEVRIKFSAKKSSHSAGELHERTLCASESFWYQKVLCVGKREGYYGFEKSFFSHFWETSLANVCGFQQSFRYREKFMDNRWGRYRVLSEKIFSQYRKTS